MKLDLRTFKKVHEDGERAVLKHADGHEIHISKDKLSPEQGIQLQALPFHAKPRMAEGGPVEDPSISSEEWKERWGKMGKGVRKAYADGGDVEPTGFDRLKERFGMDASEPQAAEPTGFDRFKERLDAPQADVTEQPQEATPFSSDPIQPYDASAQAPGSDLGVQSAPSLARAPAEAGVATAPGPAQGQDALAQDSSQYAKGAKAEADAAGQLGREQGGMQDRLGQQQADLQTKFEEGSARIQNDRARIKHDMENNLIDPQRYLGKQSTAGTVLSAIGLLLGGLGQGGGGENLALKTMDTAIAQDIEAQKANMGQRQSLLEANFKEYGDLESASKMTAINMRDVAISHLEAAASRAKDPIAKARAQMAIAEFKSKNDKEAQELAIKRSEADIKVDEHKSKLLNAAKSQALLAHAGGDTDPASLIVAAGVPEADRKVVADEIGRAQNIQKNTGKILAAYDKAQEQFKLTPWDRSGVKELHQLLLPNFKQVDGTVRQAAMDETFKNVTPSALDFDDSQKTKRKSLINWMTSEQAAPHAKTYGIDLTKFNSTKSPSSGTTKVTDSSGVVGSIPNEQLTAALQSGKYRLKK